MHDLQEREQQRIQRLETEKEQLLKPQTESAQSFEVQPELRAEKASERQAALQALTSCKLSGAHRFASVVVRRNSSDSRC